MLPYVIYCRRSQERDERQQQSLEDQQSVAFRIRDSRHLEVIEEITESVSAKEPYKRPGFTRLIDLIEKGKVGGIIAWHPDRLSRNEIDAAMITYLIRKGKLLDLQFGNYTFDNSPEGIMMLQMALSQSQYFSSKLAKDVTRGMNSKVEKGWFPHRAPEGYCNVTEMQGYLPFRKIVKDAERFDLIRAFWELILAGTTTVPEALRILNEDWGYRTRPSQKLGGGPLSRASAYKLLGNPFYTGYFIRRGATHRGLHEPMVTIAEFDRVQEILQRTGKPHPKKHEFAYTGLIRCSRCGSMVTAGVHRGRSGRGHYVYYHCTNAKGNCLKCGIREEQIEAQIERELRSIYIDERLCTSALKALSRWNGTASKADALIVGQRQETLHECRKKLDTLLDLRLRDMVSDAVFSEKRAALEHEIARLEAAASSTKGDEERIRASASSALAFRSQAVDRLLVGSVAEKRAIAAALAKGYTYDGSRLSIERHPALAKIGTIEALDSSSESTEKTAREPPVSGGVPEELDAETLYTFFRDRPPFEAPAFLALPEP